MLKEMVCEILPTKNCHASTVLPLADGSVVCAWFGGSREGRDDVDIWFSRRDENGWCEPKRLTHADGIPHWNPVLLLLPNGNICLFFKVGKHIPSWRTYFAISTDGGRSFGEPAELVKGDRSGGRGPVKNKCIKLSSGRILAPASTENRGWNCFVDISDDGGKTWKKTAKVPTEKISPILNSQNNYCSNLIPMIQPTLWESADGKVHMLTRTAVGSIYRSDSEDGGESWCRAYSTGLPNNNSGIDLVKVPCGDLYLVSNPVAENWGARSPITLSRSKDNGETWETLLTLEEKRERKEYSYPGIEYLDGSLFITYTHERHNVAFWKIALDELG